jgi:hypothetical protein
MARSQALHRGYVSLLEESLANAAPKVETESASTVQEGIDVRDRVVEHLDALDPETPPARSGESLRAFVEPVHDLTSGDAVRIRRVFAVEAPLPAPLIGFAVVLLADKEVHLDAIRALRKVASSATGQLIDALCDPNMSFDIRRRIPRVFSECSTERAVDGLVRGLDDDRFEVRYACGRALLTMTAGPTINIGAERMIAIVNRELKRAKPVWESQTLDEDDPSETPRLSGRLLNDEIDRSKEHVFNLLALHLDPEAVRTAFNALHTENAHLRGTALEYLDTVLPSEVRDLIWPFLGMERPMRAERPATEILADLHRSA